MRSKIRIILSLVACIPILVNYTYSINDTNEMQKVAESQLEHLMELEPNDSLFDYCPDIIVNTETKIGNFEMQKILVHSSSLLQMGILLTVIWGVPISTPTTRELE